MSFEGEIGGDSDEVVLSPDQEKILEKLKSAKSSAERVDVVATALDTFGLDPLIGLIPGIGDATASIIPGLYLLAEAKNADLDGVDYLKIIALQVADFAIGAIPVAGDVSDYLFQANKMSATLFAENMLKVKQEALAMGIPPEQVAKISEDGKNLPILAKQAITMAGKAKS